jgi:hypothetical protein
VISAVEILPKIWIDEITESLFASDDFCARADAVESVMYKHLNFLNFDSRIARFLEYAFAASRSSNLELSDKSTTAFGLSSRQLRRLSHLYL